jgi:hypothetical protein
MRFTQAQPPSELGLVLIATQKLNEERGKLLGCASKALAGKERPQNRVGSDTPVKVRRQPSATRFPAECLQESSAHVYDCPILKALRPFSTLALSLLVVAA